MKLLILFGHPAFQNSIINKELIKGIKTIKNVTFHDLYEEYPEMDIDIDKEQDLLLKHDCIIFMFPMFWFSTPAVFKEWQDLVLEHGWAFGSDGRALEGKLFFCALSTGASRLMYNPGEMKNHTLNEFLIPLFQMASHCSMIPLPPFVSHGGHALDISELEENCKLYHSLITLLTEDKLDVTKAMRYEYLNDFIKKEI
jgi:glutathione-regulated potassium-efflux system ancillary protein KefG